MTDRQPTYPGRVKLTPVAGQENTYDMERADEPTEEGTPLNKSTLLQDATCQILDIPNTSVPNDAFLKLALGIGQYGYAITVVYPDGSPVEGATLNGINAPNGGPAVTDENGLTVGVSSSQSITVKVNSPYIDVQNSSEIIIQSTGTLTKSTVTLQYDESIKTFTSSQIVKISPKAVSADFCTVGGGGAGSPAIAKTRGGAGGGGGNIANSVNVLIEQETNVSITVGAGGDPISLSNGGTTEIRLNDNLLISATGGNSANGEVGGTGNGNGGNAGNGDSSPTSGGNATGYLFNDSSLGIAGSGGGAGGGYSRTPASGGAPNGAQGGYANAFGEPQDSSSGVTPGGGGGGAGFYFSNSTALRGGAGADGGAYIRVKHI